MYSLPVFASVFMLYVYDLNLAMFLKQKKRYVIDKLSDALLSLTNLLESKYLLLKK